MLKQMRKGWPVYMKKKKRLGYSSEQAESELSSAFLGQLTASLAYSKARKDELHWKTVCEATSLIFFVNIGTCVKYLTVRTDAENDYNKKQWALERAEGKVRTAERIKKQF